MLKTPHEAGTGSEWEPQRLIIEAAQTGDLDALGSLYDSHINQVYRYALARLGNVHDAEDVAEEIFLKMLAGLPSYQWRKVPFAAWLMTFWWVAAAAGALLAGWAWLAPRPIRWPH